MSGYGEAFVRAAPMIRDDQRDAFRKLLHDAGTVVAARVVTSSLDLEEKMRDVHLLDLAALLIDVPPPRVWRFRSIR